MAFLAEADLPRASTSRDHNGQDSPSQAFLTPTTDHLAVVYENRAFGKRDLSAHAFQERFLFRTVGLLGDLISGGVLERDTFLLRCLRCLRFLRESTARVMYGSPISRRLLTVIANIWSLRRVGLSLVRALPRPISTTELTFGRVGDGA